MNTFIFYYEKYYKLIHYLLQKYHIHYNYEDYFQLLVIKLWELLSQYDPQHKLNLNSYVYQRLRFYLLDQFRKNAKTPETCALDTAPENANHLQYTPTTIQDFFFTASQLLTPNEAAWLSYYLQGYKQYEICAQMQKSDSTIRRYKQSARCKLRKLLSEGGL